MNCISKLCDFYKDDIKPEILHIQLVTFGTNFQNNPEERRPSIRHKRLYCSYDTSTKRSVKHSCQLDEIDLGDACN